jgi:acetyltransferase
MKPHYLSPFFAPQSIAIVGASNHSDSVGGQVLRNLLASGYRGVLYPVNLHDSQIQGLRAYAKLSDIAAPIDLVMLATPAATIPDLVDQCGALGLSSIIVLSMGFSESGPAGAQLEAAMLACARQHRIRILGPNCLGVMRPAIGLTLPFVKAGGVALVSQSTALTSGVLDWASGNEIGFSTVVSVGNSADIDFAEIIDFLVSDILTQSILMFIETIRDPRHFMSTLREAARVKPVIVLKADRWGQIWGQTPIGGLSPNPPNQPEQSDAIFDAALRRAGVVRVRSMTQLFSAARACSVRYRKSGPRLAIISNGQGPGALAADHAFDNRIPLARLSTDTLAHLSTLMPAHWDGSNPLDLGNTAGARQYRDVTQAVLADPGVDCVLVMLCPQMRSEPTETAEQLAQLARTTSKPLMACWMGDRNVLRGRTLLSAAQVPNFRTPESAVDAMHYVALYHRNQQMLFQTPPPSTDEQSPLLPQAKTIVQQALAASILPLSESNVEKLFAAFHLVYRAGIRPPLLLGRTLDQRSVSMGLVRDPTLGPALFLGPTGIAAELPKAMTYALPPLNGFLAQELIERSTIAPLLAERGEARAINHEGLTTLLLRLSEMACELAEVAEIRLDAWLSPDEPVLITHAEVRLTDEAPPKNRYGHMAVHPYPVDLIRHISLKDGSEITLRPIRPEDAEMEQTFVKSLSEDTRYFRFMDALRELPRSLLVRFTQLDYQREMAIIALTGSGDTEQQVAVARYTTNPDGESCEFAVVIADAWQGKGLGTILMRYLMEIAGKRGLKIMEGEVLGANPNMLHLMASLGFTSKTSPEDPAIRLVSAPLSPA